MTTPTTPLFKLSLHSPQTSPLSPHPLQYPSMAPGETVRERALIVQDIVSGFDANTLPCETCPTIFDNILQNSDKLTENWPPSHEWTIQNDLEGTLLNWAAYDTGFYNSFCKLRDPKSRAVLFREKIEKRFSDCVSEYDQLMRSPPPGASELRDAVSTVTQKFWEHSEILCQDRELRQSDEIEQIVESRTALGVLSILGQICERDKHSPANGSLPTLFKLLIVSQNPDRGPFLVASLERFTRDALNPHTTMLASIGEMLEKSNAPAAYLDRYRALQEKANEPAQREISGGSSGHNSGHEADPRTGTKRTQRGSRQLPHGSKRGRKNI